MRVLATLALLPLLAGCMATDTDDVLDEDSYHMQLSGMPMGPVAPGAKFNVTVKAMDGGAGHMHTSDHIGAHFWNATQADPTGALMSAMTCAHRGGDLPGTYEAMCTAPMAPGTYHLRSHARMSDDDAMMHHWWSDEQTFTVA